MRNPVLIALQVVILSLAGSGQETNIAQAAPSATEFSYQHATSESAGVSQKEPGATNSSGADSLIPSSGNSHPTSHRVEGKFSYYLKETYLNPTLFTGPAFGGSLHMAHPSGKGLTRYPDEWRQGAEGFARNYGDSFAVRISTHTALFLTGTLTREDPHYMPSASRNFFVRTSHALAFTFVDRSDSGRRVPALSNFASAAAGGLVGNAYLPEGFRDLTHTGQRATFQMGLLGAGNLFREFAPQMPAAVRGFISLLAR